MQDESQYRYAQVESQAVSPATPKDPGAPLGVSDVHEYLFIAVVVLAQFMAQAGLSQGIAAAKTIGGALGVENPGEQAWYIDHSQIRGVYC
jgi:hypothetical protein